MIRCIEVSLNGPIVQGEAEVQGLRTFQTGRFDPTGHATITVGNQKLTGPLLASIRRTWEREQ